VIEGGEQVVLNIVYSFASGCIPSPSCRQAVGEIELRVVSQFDETVLNLLDEYRVPPIPEPLRPTVDDQACEVVIDPALIDGVVRLRPFVRGDTDGTGTLELADVITLLGYLFLGAVLSCPDPADANDDGQVDVSDAIYLLRHFFGGAPAPPPPAGEAGLDPTEDDLDCAPLPVPGNCPG
jgi:hypothetical protein